MARVTVEDCLEYVSNRYALVHLCTRRARQLYMGSDPMISSDNGVVVTALREIAANKVRFLPTAKHDADDKPASNMTQ